MLCANLFIAQLVFVVGVERTENEVKSVLLSSSHWSSTLLHTAGCLFSHCCVAPLPVPGGVHVDAKREGVVLYLVLVKVFVKHNTKRYIAAFTISSYG